MTREAGEPRELVFRRRHRLSRSRDYASVFDARVSARRGPITVFGRPNGLDHPRLGLSVGRRVGRSVVRHAVKRRLREAFRLLRPRMPRGYDLVVTVRAHKVMTTQRYLELLEGAVSHVDKQWSRRTPEGEAGGGA
jgi:ribonuclease P protein component